MPVAKSAELVRRGRVAARRCCRGAAIEGDGTFFEPPWSLDVQPGSDILREEIFGPVLAIVPFADEARPSAANDTEYGLVSYVYTKDLARGQRMIERVETGMMGLNVGVVSNAGRAVRWLEAVGPRPRGRREGIHEYLSTKYTLTPDPFA
jgi:succinate-semialdehyde dehydrogenase/glutarate-semialdehyde dehydrogenase